MICDVADMCVYSGYWVASFLIDMQPFILLTSDWKPQHISDNDCIKVIPLIPLVTICHCSRQQFSASPKVFVFIYFSSLLVEAVFYVDNIQL